MRFVSKFETDTEIFAIVAIEKEPLKIPMCVTEVKVNDIPDEQIIGLIKEQINAS